MKQCLLILMLFAASVSSGAVTESNRKLFERLDSMIANEDVYVRRKLDKISEVKRESRNVRSREERYWLNKRLYDEYFVFDADSAMRYVDDNLAIAQALDNPVWIDEWKIKRSFIFSVMGLLKDAEDELTSIDVGELSEDLLAAYYSQWSYLTSHLSQFAGLQTGRADYDELTRQYNDSTFAKVTRDNPLYLWYKGASQLGMAQGREAVMHDLKLAVDTAALDSRIDAMNAYRLAHLYADEGDQDNYLHYMILSGIADVATANRDIASLEELSALMLENDDIDRAYSYINYCQHQATALPNNIRAATLSGYEAQIHRLYVEKLKDAGERMGILLIVLGVATVLLILLLLAVINRHRKLSALRDNLKNTNERLNMKVSELKVAKERSEGILQELKSANERIKEINLALKEANYVKEECIGATFALCSSYIDLLDDQRKSVARLVRANSWNELRKEVSSSSYSGEELKNFYKSFDELFLNIYPDFVKDFNDLLKPDEQITVKSGELNTELRIYALVRLGITDSVKIASMLHCSPQTVYNYRLRTRNKSNIPKKEFAEAVKSLGKFQNQV